MPMAELVHASAPPPPEVLAAGADLHYRDFLTVALVMPFEAGFPDNWIYVHAPDVKVGRIQNFGPWSPYMVREGRPASASSTSSSRGTSCGRGRRRAHRHGDPGARPPRAGQPGNVERGYVVRVPKAYPYYDFTYRANVTTVRNWLATEAPNMHPIGRNGMHKYNNQDHSMYTAMLTVENMYGADHDIWAVNVEEEYHEAGSTGTGGRPGSAEADGGGQDFCSKFSDLVRRPCHGAGDSGEC